MDVEAAEARQVQYGLRQNLAIRHHDNQVRLQRTEGFEEGFIARAFGLEDREAGLQREFLHRGRLQLQRPSLGPVRLRDDRHDLELRRFNQRPQAVTRQFGCAHEEDA